MDYECAGFRLPMIWWHDFKNHHGASHLQVTFLLRRVIGLCLLHANHISYSLASWHITESRSASKTSVSLLMKDAVLCYTHAAYDFSQHPLFVCVNGPSIRSSHRKSAGIPWSRNPVAGRPQNWSQHTSCNSVTWDASDLTVTADWKACHFTLAMTKLQRTQLILQWDMADIFTVPSLELDSIRAGCRRVTRACSKCFLLSHRVPVTHRLSLNRNTLLYNWRVTVCVCSNKDLRCIKSTAWCCPFHPDSTI